MITLFQRFCGSTLLVLIATVSGCGWLSNPQMQLPRFGSPGPANYQQYNAVRYDPYPQDDLGPAVVGGRPRDYQKPPDTVNQVRQTPPYGNWRGR